MENCFTRIIYRSDEASLYEDIFTDRGGIKRSFYCLIVDQEAYCLSKEEGLQLEKKVESAYLLCHCDGIELSLIESSLMRTTDKHH